MGQGGARGRRVEQRASQQICAAWKRSYAVLPGSQYGMDAPRSQGWIGFRRRTRCVEPRFRQHRPVQRGVAGALQTVCGRHEVHPFRNCGREQELELLEGDRSANRRCGAVFSRHGPARLLEGCARRPSIPFKRQGRARSRQGRVCRALCPMPLEQAPRRGFPYLSAAVLYGRQLPQVLERLLELHQERGVQEADDQPRVGR